MAYFNELLGVPEVIGLWNEIFIQGATGPTGPSGGGGGGSGPLGFVVNSSISYQRDLVTFYDPDGPKTIRRSFVTTDPLTGEPKFVVQLASFSPGLAASALPFPSVEWDVACSGFIVSVTNPTDFTSEYISSVYAIAQAGGSVYATLANYTTSGPVPTPAGGVSWNQTFSTNGTAYIRSTSTTTAGGSASGTITFNCIVGTSPASPYGTTVSFTVNWADAGNSISIAARTGQTFLTTYASTGYSVAVSGILTPANYANAVTPTGGTISNPSGSGTFTFTTPIHKDNGGSRSLALATTFTRPANVTGTSYSVTLNTTASPTASFTYPSFYYFTVGTTTVPTKANIISGSGCNTGGGVTVLGDNQTGIPTREIENTNANPRAFWFGLRSSLSQPTIFQIGPTANQLADVAYVNGGTVALAPDSPPDGYSPVNYTLYGIILQPGKAFVRIA
jgi:hypothetical protein